MSENIGSEIIKRGVTLALFVDREVVSLVALRTNSGLVLYSREPNTGKEREQSTYVVDALRGNMDNMTN